MYSKGEGVRRNPEEALWQYRLAASQGHIKAQYHLGTLFYEGEGVDQSYKEALEWFQLAAQQGHTASQRIIETLELRL